MTTFNYIFSYDVSGRAAQAVVRDIGLYKASIYIEKDSRTINGASLIGLLSLSIKSGDSVKFYIKGNNEQEEETIANELSSIL